MKFSLITAVVAATIFVSCSADNIVEIAVGSNPEEFNTLVAAVLAAGLAEALSGGSLTVFAPTDAAFAELGKIVDFLLIEDDYTNGLLTNVLTYHVLGEEIDSVGFGTAAVNETTLSGQSVTVDIPSNSVNDATIVTPNVEADNGVIHVIDSVLIPPGFPAKNIYQIANTTEGFSVLAGALDATGLTSVLDDPQGKVYTVFAPTDEAFGKFLAKIPGASLELILSDPYLTFLLKLTLLKHVVPGAAIDAATLTGFSRWKRIRTASGFRFRKNTFLSKVTTTDLAALQGYVHVLDEVITTRACMFAFKRRVKRVNRIRARAARRHGN